MRTQSKLLWTLRGDICGSGRRRVAPQVLGNGNFSNRAFEADATLNALLDSCRTSTPTPTPPPALPDPVIYPTLRHPHSTQNHHHRPFFSLPSRLGSNNPPPIPFFFLQQNHPQAPSRNPTRILLTVREPVTWPRNANAAIVAWPGTLLLA